VKILAPLKSQTYSKPRLHIPFGRKQAYAKEVMKASLERLARLIKVCGFLMQTKVYLFWERASKGL